MTDNANRPQADPEQQKPFVLRWPRATALFAALFASVQSFGVGAGLLQTFRTMEDHRAQVIAAGLVTAIAGAIAVYFLIAHLAGAAMPLRAVRASATVLTLFLAFLSGQIATLITFGDQGPWGHIVKGISGPLTDGFLNGLVPSTWWPVPFALGALATLLLARWLWDKAKGLGVEL